MSVYKILENGNPILKVSLTGVSEDCNREGLKSDLIETMKEHGGIGLSANQVGLMERVFVFYEDFKTRTPVACFNPKVIETSEERTTGESVVEGDNYSIINCCGDFQIAHKDVWNEIRGFEEELIYVLYSDTNVQKKALMHGFELKALYNPALFHIEHGKGGGGFLDGINKKTNDPHRAIVNQFKTYNPDTWGFNDIEIEYETI